MDKFEEIFEKLAKMDDPTIIFNNWLDWVIDQNLVTTKNYCHNFKGHENEYFKMFQEWVNIQQEKLENYSWFDYLGVFYENIVQSKYKAGNRGQFFTPASVCDAMVKINFCEGDDLTGCIINDCACGSGRLLLSGQVMNPGAVFIGEDLDSTACKMCVCNFFVHGTRGVVINRNTLTGEFYGVWRVNNYLGYGLSVPHIEVCSSVGDALNVFGIKRNDDEIWSI